MGSEVVLLDHLGNLLVGDGGPQRRLGQGCCGVLSAERQEHPGQVSARTQGAGDTALLGGDQGPDKGGGLSWGFVHAPLGFFFFYHECNILKIKSPVLIA